MGRKLVDMASTLANRVPAAPRDVVARLVASGVVFAVSIARWSFGRTMLAHVYLEGNGLEIGGLNHPLGLPRRARARYVDRMPVSELRLQYPELAGVDLVGVDIIDDGELLSTVADCSQDFVIANHFLEHCQNPILAIQNLLRVVRPGGVVFLAVPDKRFTFDVERPVTPWDHLVQDFAEGPEWSRWTHYREWARYVNHVPENQVVERAQELLDMDYSIHFHVWTECEYLLFLTRLRADLDFNFDVLAFTQQGNECVSVLRKGAGAPAAVGKAPER